MKVSDIEQDRLARETSRRYIYQFLSIALSNPRSKRWQMLCDSSFMEAALLAGRTVSRDPDALPSQLAPGELSPDTLDIAPPAETIRNGSDSILRDYQRIFGLLMPRECPPYETEYCPQTFSVYRSQRMSDVAGFYRAFGLEPSRDMPERHDHISLELEFMAWLIAKELHAGENRQKDEKELCRSAQKRFFREHIAWWATAFSQALRGKATDVGSEAGHNFYSALSTVLSAFMAAERSYLAVKPPTELVEPKPQEDIDLLCDGCGFKGG